MCLKKITSYHPSTETLGGWKVFVQNPVDKRLKTPYEEKLIEPGMWIKADKKPIVALDQQPYDSGFHLYIREEDARIFLSWYKAFDPNAVLKYVKYRKARVVGIEPVGGYLNWQNAEVVVADEIYLPTFCRPSTISRIIIAIVFLLLILRIII